MTDASPPEGEEASVVYVDRYARLPLRELRVTSP